MYRNLLAAELQQDYSNNGKLQATCSNLVIRYCSCTVLLCHSKLLSCCDDYYNIIVLLYI